MPGDLEYRCNCGKLKAKLHGVSPRAGNRARCHCRDCQAFAIWLSRQGGAGFLDDCGGTELYQTLAWRLEFTEGKENYLAAIRLSPKGMIRWYARCCAAPFGNTMASESMTFTGLPMSGFRDRDAAQRMGPVRASFAAAAARPDCKPPADFGVKAVVLRILWRHLTSRLTAKTRATPFFRDGAPVVVPKILTLEERQAVTPAT